MSRLTTTALLGAFALGACAAPIADPSFVKLGGQPVNSINGFSVAPANAPSGPVVDNFARSFLNNIQAQSIQDHAEYCGYFFIDETGRLSGTPPIRGRLASCEMPAPQAGQGIIASYHTHGAFDRGYDNEVPSVIDLQSDFQFGIDGYVSTPGGRVWLVDFQTQSTRQLCGQSCVYSDPSFSEDPQDRIQAAYTLPDLQRRQAGF